MAATSQSPHSAQATAPASRPRLLFADHVSRSFRDGQQRVRVIVNLVPPARALQATNWRSTESRQTLRAANRAAQDDVLKTLAANEHQIRFRFDNQPGFSCEVTETALEKLLNNPLVESIEPVQELQAHLAQGISLINALASRSTYNGTNMAIAICDTGIDYNHPRLGGGGFPNSKVLGGYDFGDSDADPIPNIQGHGTSCAGIAAGDLGTVGDYIGGVAPGAKLYALKISAGSTGSATSDAMAAAWDWCVTHQNDNPAYPIMVISTSFGGGRSFSACDGDVPAMTTAANNAVAAGITVLASSGNDGYCDSIAWPACISNVVAVGAVYDANFGQYLPCINSNSCAPKTTTGGCTTGWYATDNTQPDKVTSYSNVASFLAVFAPGNECYTLDLTGSGGYNAGFGGTSAACPYAAGAVACLQHAAKSLTGSYLTPAEVRTRLAASGDPVTDTKVAITKPRVNLGNAIASLPQGAVITAASATLTAESCVATNGAIDPDETVTVNFSLQNIGSADASNVVATLLATGGITSPSGPETYGLLDTNGAVVTQPFTFTANGTCGSNITATLQLQDGTNLLGNVQFAFPLGSLGTATTNTYSSGGIATAIPDVSTVDIPISVTDTGIVTDVNVRVRLDHTFDGDLVISLVHPDNTVVTLSANHGSSGANYGSGATDCSGTFTVFDDAGGTAISAGAAPFAGTFSPDSPLSVLNGKPTQGTWILRVADTASIDTGTIYCAQLQVARHRSVCCGGPAQPPLIVAAGNTLTAENCLPANGAIDPGEMVTVNFALQNTGGADASNVVATLQATGGVTLPSSSQAYGTLVAGGAAVTNSFTFTASGACGSNITATLQLQDGTNSLGTVAFTFSLGTSTPVTNSFTNTTFITIPASGAATPYPSSNTVSSLAGLVTKVTVTLSNITHAFPDDIDVLLVGPAGQKVVLMSDAGAETGATDLNNVTITLDDNAASFLPDNALITTGTYRPSNYVGLHGDSANDTFAAPAPAAPYGSTLSVFNGINPNGVWRLFVFDDFNPDGGSIGGGWSLKIITAVPNCCSAPANFPPVVTNAFITPSLPDTTQTLTAFAFASDPDSNAVTFAYQWEQSTNDVVYTNLTGQTVSTLPAAATIAGDFYRVIVTPNDGLTNGTPFTTASVLVPVDADGNDINDDWEVQYFGNVGIDPNADPDGDGFNNLQEFLAGTDPTDPNSALRITSIAINEPDVVISFTTCTNKLYDLQFNDDLITTNWNAAVTNIPGTGAIVPVTDPGAASLTNRFYRVRLLP